MAAGLLYTSAVIHGNDSSVQRVPLEKIAVSAISLAELPVCPILASSVTERFDRQARLQQIEATFDPIPFDAAAARSFGQIVAAVSIIGRKHRSRMADLLIAAIAHANGFELHTRNPDDFVGFEELIQIIDL
jgi:predicted nucleic acid-binding protein